MPLDREHAGLVVQLLGHVLADALHRLTAAAGGVLGLVADLMARQVRRQRQPLGALLVLALGLGGLLDFDLGGQRGQVGVQRLLDQALLLGREGFGLGRELQSLEHGHLVRELVDGGLLEGHFACLPRDEFGLRCRLGLRGAQGLSQLLRLEGVDELVGDHG